MSEAANAAATKAVGPEKAALPTAVVSKAASSAVTANIAKTAIGTVSIPINSDSESSSSVPSTTDAAVQTQLRPAADDTNVTDIAKPIAVGPTIIRLQAVSPTASVTISSRHSSVSSLASTSDSCQAVSTGGAVTKSILSAAAVAGSGTIDRKHQAVTAGMTATKSNLNQAMAIVANKWDREQRKQDQEVTRRLTVLRQRKISAVLKVRLFLILSYRRDKCI